MSLKLRALLADDYRSKIEHSYMTNDEFIVLHGVPCEMTFESSGGWLEFESEQHSYLPLFHITGRVKSISGNFPYNVSTLFFADSDLQKMKKDILYYMNPEELAHMITVGRFFTDQFKLPEILVRNEYSFPCLVDLTIIPPENPVAYEQMTYSGGVTEDSVGGIGKDNLPIFYVGMAGTGITRKQDPLLDYYGIDFDEDYPVYALTAESSGYTDPPLMEYITEPIQEAEEVLEDVDEMYMDDRELIETQEEKEEMADFVHEKNDKIPDFEDVIVEEAYRRIKRRVDSKGKFGLEENMESQQERQDREAMEEMMRREKEQAEAEARKKEEQKRKQTTLDKLASLSQMLQKPATPKPVVKEEPKQDVLQETGETPHVVERFAVEQPKQQEETPVFFVEENTVQGKDVTAESKKLTQPENPQQMKEVLMDLNPEKRETVEEKKAEMEGQTGLDADETDFRKLSDAKGADVSDARLQTKLDEAKALQEAMSVAVDKQKDIHEESNAGRMETSDRAEKPETSSYENRQHRDEVELVIGGPDSSDKGFGE